MAGQKMNTRKGQLSLLIMLGAAACLMLFFCECDQGEDLKHEETIRVEEMDPRVIISPGLAGVIRGNTLEVPQNPNPPPLVRKFPEFAGVENIGEIGMGAAAGFNPGERVIVPINVNLGSELLASYVIRITLPDPTIVNVDYLAGSFDTLAERYPTQYAPAPGFEAQPQFNVNNNQVLIQADSQGNPATGRINLCNIALDILQELPPSGLIFTFEVIALQGGQGQDLCATLNCQPIDGIVIEGFVIRAQ